MDEEAGAYGEFTVLVDGQSISRGNFIATTFAVLPRTEDILVEVRKRLAG